MDVRPCRLRLGAGLWALVLLAACGGGPSAGPASTAPDTTAATTTTRPATTTGAPTTTRPATTTTSTPREGDTRFEPACVEQDAVAAVVEDDPALDTLGLLGAEPVLRLELPDIPVDPSVFRTLDIPRTEVARIPGGVLVSMRPWDGTADFGQIVAVDRSGAVRWRRCLDAMPFVRVAGSGHGTEALVGWYEYQPDGTFLTTLVTWSLADGRPVRTWEQLLATAGVPDGAVPDQQIAEGRDVMVFAGRGTGATPAGPLLLLDLRTMTPTAVSDPRSVVPGLPVDVRLGVVADDVVVAYSPTPEAPWRVGAVWTGTTWSSDAAEIAAAVPVTVDFVYGPDGETLHATAPDGRTRWHRDDVYVRPGEGFRLSVDGSLAVASTCAGPLQPAGEWCPGAALQGFDVATGRTRWQRDGSWSVAFVGDGVAMIAGPFDPDATVWTPPVWRMVDTATGEQLTDRTWTDPWDFSIGCCDSPSHLGVSGGVVVTWDGNTVELWYPDAALSGPGRT